MIHDARTQALTEWLQQYFPLFAIKPLAHDASARRYFRVFVDQKTFVAMDAPPEKENSLPFVAIAHTFASLGLQVPTIYHCDLGQGFLLLTDFGDKRFDRCLTLDTADTLYGDAFSVIHTIQQCRGAVGWTLPVLDRAFMLQELFDFQSWYIHTHLGITLTRSEQTVLENAFMLLSDTAGRQQYVCMHRDFHSRNLMCYDGGVGILDFQSAMLGPVTYDCMSLLKDCYLTWPREHIDRWVLQFHAGLSTEVSAEAFLRDADFMGVQRHLKAIMTFSRKKHRDDDPNYLCYIENTLQYVRDVTIRYRELSKFDLLLRHIHEREGNERNDTRRRSRHAHGAL